MTDQFLILHFPDRVPAMKSKRQLTLRGNKPIMIKDKTVTNYVNKYRSYLEKQFASSDFDVIPFPQQASIRLLIFGKDSKDVPLPTFDIDGIKTTVMEMLQPSVVSNMGVVACVGNDVQIRNSTIRSRKVPYRPQERTLVAVWATAEDEEIEEKLCSIAGNRLNDWGKEHVASLTGELQSLLDGFDI